MRTTAALVSIAVLLGAGTAPAADFVYRGSLEDGGAPAEGEFDLRLALHAGPAGTTALAAPLEFRAVPVRNGRFELALDLPELPALAAGAWLQLAVRAPGESNWSEIQGRTPVASKGLVCPVAWSLQGNADTDPAFDFLGTTDAQAFELRTAGQRSLRIEPSALLFQGLPATVNMIGGSSANSVDAGVRGATIAGGGVPDSGDFGNPSDPAFQFAGPNRVSDSYGSIGGGFLNRAGNETGTLLDASFATVGGGSLNRAQGEHSTVSGGTFNLADGIEATVVGGRFSQASGRAATVGGGASLCAGGDFSWVGGRGAKARFGTGHSVNGNCIEGGSSGDANGDEGTFVWGDSRSEFFVSSGPDQFLVRASGGAVFQPDLGSNGARRPRGFFNVVRGSAGISEPASPDPATVASFERDGNAFLRILAPQAADKGLLFGGPDNPDDGGISYSGPVDALEFRAGGNVGMRLSSGGVLQVQGLGSAGSTTLCRNASNQIATCSSSERYKTDIEDLELGLALVQRLRPVSYRWREGGAADVGFVAEEVAELDPRLVVRDAEGRVEGVKYERLSAVLAGAVQELAARDAQRTDEARALAERSARLETELGELRARLDALEARRP